MSLASAALPADPDALRAFALACQQELVAAKFGLQLRVLEIEKLKVEIARLRRMAFGRSSEQLDRQIGQLELQLEELETSAAEVTGGDDAAEPDVDKASAPIKRASKPKRAPLPEHLPRETIVHEPAHDAGCTCTACGAAMGKLGEDVTEVLDYVPGRFQVIRHVRPKYACKRCDAISQAPVPNLPILRGRATPSLLAMIVVSKYIDHRVPRTHQQRWRCGAV
jgi:transposase